jgi:tetratricopeptide (TPR) repeat protein
MCDTGALRLVLASLALLGRCLERQGLHEQAAFYFQQGRDISLQCNSSLDNGYFTIALTNLTNCKGQREASKDLLQLAKTALSSVCDSLIQHHDFIKPCVGLHLLEGDMSVTDDMQQARDEYLQAQSLIETGLDPKFIDEFDHLDLRSLVPKPKHAEGKGSKCDLISRCTNLENLKSEVFCRFGMLLTQQRKLKEAESSLKLVSEMKLTSDDRV